jgi:hypothetical protein
MYKMKNKINILFAVMLSFVIAIPLTTLNTNVQAQLAPQQPVSGSLTSGVTVDIQADSESFLSVRPKIVGIGQPILINMWVNPAPHAHRMYTDYKLTIIKPDGTQDVYTMNSYVADGTMWMELAPDQLGEWQFKMEFPGMYFPAGRYFEGNIIDATTGGSVYNQAAYVKPSATPITKITVQNEPVQSWPASPLPTEYWSRPVSPEHKEWWPIMGNYPWFGPGGAEWDKYYPNTNPYKNDGQNFVPWVQVPESAHIVWKRQTALGGIVGGDVGDDSVYWDVTAGFNGAPNVILWGRSYQTITKPSTTGPSGQTWWQCYDLRTGEIYWERPLVSGEAQPNLIEYGITALAPVPGVAAKPDTPYLLSISNGYLRKYDAFSGHMLSNISISPMTGSGGTYYMNGHVLGVQDLGAAAGAERYRFINWTTFGTGNFASRIISNTTYARSSLTPSANTDFNVGLGATISGTSTGGISNGTVVTGFNLYTGQQLWQKTIPEPLFSGSACVADHGKISIVTTRGHVYALDLATGNTAWKTRQLDYPYDSTGWGSYSTITAYGNLYWIAQTGIYSIDWATGNINWKFETPMPYQYEGPFTGADGQTVYPYHAPGLTADGKIIVTSSRHSPESPYLRGLRTFIVDAFTGEEIWSIGISAAAQHTRGALQMRVADGYLTIGARDGMTYVIGKGLSQTTVAAPSTNVKVGEKFTITGTVLDLSPAQYGTASIADEDMDRWMEHLHLQLSKPTDAKGVPVALTAIDPNGNLINIGTATSNINGVFGIDWAPEIPGLYEITATFAGSGSYSSSAASTYFTAIEAPAATSEPTPQPLSAADMYFIPATAGIIIAIIIVGILLAFLLLKKRP